MQFNQEYSPFNYVIRKHNHNEITVSIPISPEQLHGDQKQTGQALSLELETHTQSFLLAPTDLVPSWPVKSTADLEEAHLPQLLKFDPEVILLGSGQRIVWPAMTLVKTLNDQNVGIEVMDTAAACRTFNILMHEGRRVLAALILE